MKNKQKIKKIQIIFCSSQKCPEGREKGEDIVPKTKTVTSAVKHSIGERKELKKEAEEKRDFAIYQKK